MVEEQATVKGRVKWFDKTKGFGFLVSEALEGDVLVHHSVVKEHGHRSLPEGAVLEVELVSGPRGLQAARVVTIDLAAATPVRRTGTPPAGELIEEPGDFEPATVKWFNHAFGYGFLLRDGQDIFIHAKVVRACGLLELPEGEPIEARIGRSSKGLVALEVRRIETPQEVPVDGIAN